MPRVLLIGNHPEFKRALETSRALADCEITTAAGNVDAVRHVRARSIDVVVTDPDTPVHDDLALVEEARSIQTAGESGGGLMQLLVCFSMCDLFEIYKLQRRN